MKKTFFNIFIFNLIFLLSAFSSTAQKFKTSCVSWAFHGFEAGTDVEPAIDTIANLGFDGIQLMICQKEDIDKLWTSEKINRVKQKLAEKNLALVSVIPFFAVYPNLGSNDPTKVKTDLETFEKCCQLAQKLGTKHLEMLPPYMSEFLGFGDRGRENNPFFIYKIDDANYKKGDKLRLKMPENLHWEMIEKRVFKVLGQCSSIAKKYGLGLILEPHYHSIIPDNNSFIRFLEKMKDSNISAEMDTGWGTQQVEYPPMVVYRTKKYLKIMQFRDVDNLTRRFVPMGEGVVDIDGTLKALQNINFQGWLSFEEVFMPTVKEDASRFLKLVNGK